jgi:hypothetical protein
MPAIGTNDCLEKERVTVTQNAEELGFVEAKFGHAETPHEATAIAEQEGSARRGGSRLIGRILPAAVRLWLRSQVEQVESLSIGLDGRDREILSGAIPAVSVAATHAVYEGIHIGELQLSAQDIRINIGQVVRGKPLRLLKAFPVVGAVALSAEDVNASVSSALLVGGLRDFWRSLLQQPGMAQAVRDRYGPLALQPTVHLKNASIQLGDQSLGLSFYPEAGGEVAQQPIILGTHLTLIAANCLQLTAARWLDSLADLTKGEQGDGGAFQENRIEALEGFQWDLGRDTQLGELVVQPERLLCKGQIFVNP